MVTLTTPPARGGPYGPTPGAGRGVLYVRGGLVDDLGDALTALAALVLDPDADAGQQVGDHPKHAGGPVAVVVEGMEDGGLVLVVGGVAGHVLAQRLQTEADGGDGGGGRRSPVGRLHRRDQGASTWAVVVAGPVPASDTVFLYGVP
ncbi:hypothetical protein [Streptomyces virginiae]|uniref:hypothetical protein n=1 Tax=Streptomyces virginiae TaxID=1961 RepID=UPI0036EF5680